MLAGLLHAALLEGSHVCCGNHAVPAGASLHDAAATVFVQAVSHSEGVQLC